MPKQKQPLLPWDDTQQGLVTDQLEYCLERLQAEPSAETYDVVCSTIRALTDFVTGVDPDKRELDRCDDCGYDNHATGECREEAGYGEEY